jgi:hypothetical protein
VCLLTGAVLGCLVVSPGCQSEEGRREWADAVADFRGDYMAMGSHDHSSPP